MIRYCLKKWDKNKGRLEAALREVTDFRDCTYNDLVDMIVKYILNDVNCTEWDGDSITAIDNGDYQGTLLFLIPRYAYQPSEYEYLVTFVNYGSCSGCDTLLNIQPRHDSKLNDGEVKDFMHLCRDIVANMIKPYNYGWREEPEFEPVEETKDND